MMNKFGADTDPQGEVITDDEKRKIASEPVTDLKRLAGQQAERRKQQNATAASPPRR